MEEILKKSIKEKKKVKEEQEHPTVEIFKRTMDLIKTGDLSELFESNEEE